MSSYCIISACQPFQRNFETKIGGIYYGTLSYALYQTLKGTNSWNESSYPAIWQYARKFSIRQIPMVESTITF